MINPEITVVHALKKRIRLHFSEPPAHSETLLSRIMDLEGVKMCSYSDITRNIVISYEPAEIALLKILKEIVMSLSTQYCMRSVSVKVRETFQFTPLSFWALIAIGSSVLARSIGMISIGNGVPVRYLEYAAASITGLAVLEHAAIEINKTGIFDPEAFSVLYLVNQIKGKHPIKGALWTWIASFGRHLVPVAQSNRIVFKLIEGVDYKSGEKYTDIVTSGSLSLLDHYNHHDISTNKKELIKGVFERYKQSQIYTRGKRKLYKRGV